jgi:hypothetical protein
VLFYYIYLIKFNFEAYISYERPRARRTRGCARCGAVQAPKKEKKDKKIKQIRKKKPATRKKERRAVAGRHPLGPG